MASPAVSVTGLQVVRGGVEVLHSLTFDLPADRVTGLLGPSGSGKTTLLRSLIGVQRVAAGRVTVLGSPAGDPRLRSEVGYASQAASVYDDLTVQENLRYFAKVLDVTRLAIDRVVEAVELGDYLHRLTGRLSGGQRSRVSLAVAMLGAPRLLLLDEPTVGLDPVLREELWQLFHRLSGQGVTLLVSSHVMDEAQRCDELLLLRDGAVLAHDTPAALERRTGSVTMDSAFLSLVRSG